MLLLLLMLLPLLSHPPSFPSTTSRRIEGSNPGLESVREPGLQNEGELFIEVLDECVYTPIARQMH